jgi:hypothetical protein
MLAESDLEGGVGEGQFGDVCLSDRNQVVQPDKSIEPTGRFAVLLGQIDGGNPAPALVGDEAGGTADPAARVEHFVLSCNFDEVHQRCGNATHRVEN